MTQLLLSQKKKEFDTQNRKSSTPPISKPSPKPHFAAQVLTPFDPQPRRRTLDPMGFGNRSSEGHTSGWSTALARSWLDFSPIGEPWKVPLPLY
jgi:hypothetical protein